MSKVLSWVILSWEFSIIRRSHRSCSVRKGVCRFQACNFIEKETLVQVFSCEFWEISRNTFFTEHFWTTVSLLYMHTGNNVKIFQTYCFHPCEQLILVLITIFLKIYLMVLFWKFTHDLLNLHGRLYCNFALKIVGWKLKGIERASKLESEYTLSNNQ